MSPHSRNFTSGTFDPSYVRRRGFPDAIEAESSTPAAHIDNGTPGQGDDRQAFRPSGAVSTRRRRSGVCKFFNGQKGFGFVLDDDADELGNVEVFVHYTAIANVKSGPNGFRSLLEGEPVEYFVAEGPKGWQAQEVTGPQRAPCIGSSPNGPGGGTDVEVSKASDGPRLKAAGQSAATYPAAPPFSHVAYNTDMLSARHGATAQAYPISSRSPTDATP
ncbi:hypothetical protein JCM8202_003018 [Rhodotorula sphaerocarpa]